MLPISQKLIDETLALYEDGGDKIPLRFSGKTILHLYPAEDTYNEDGTLSGYYQVLFFNLVIFNESAKGVRKMWKVGKRDAIDTDGCAVKTLSVFKDGAFCVQVNGNINFIDAQRVTFIPSEEYERLSRSGF